DHGAHRATGDDASTLGSRLHVPTRRAVAGLHRVPQGAAIELNVAHALAGVFHRLLDRDRHFARLAVAEADLAGAVTHHRQRGEGELATTLDGLADAVDRDQLFDHAVIDFLTVAVTPPRFTFVSHFSSWMLGRFACGLAAYGCVVVRSCRWDGNPSQASGAGCAGSWNRCAEPKPHAPGHQNCRPPSRAASASTLMRPWSR